MKINFHIELEILLVTKEKNYNKGEDKKFPKMRVVGQNRVSHVVYIPLHVENEIEQRNIQKYNFVFQLGQKAFPFLLLFHEMVVEEKVWCCFKIL